MTGLELDGQALELTRQLLANESEDVRNRVTLMHGGASVTNLLPEHFDTVLFCDVLEHSSTPDSLLRQGLILLKPGGRIIAMAFHGVQGDHSQGLELQHPLALSDLVELMKPHCVPEDMAILGGQVLFCGRMEIPEADSWSRYDAASLLRMLEKASMDGRLIAPRAADAARSLPTQPATRGNAPADTAESPGAAGAVQALEKLLSRKDELIKDLTFCNESLRERVEISRLALSKALAKVRSNKYRKRIKREIDLLRKHRLFDAEYYLATYPDIAASGMDPAEHFVLFGWAEFRRPNEYFDTYFYCSTYKDILDSMSNPLVHFIRHGWEEKRDPGPRFCTAFYLENNTDVAEAGINPLTHYITSGKAEGRKSRPVFRARPAQTETANVYLQVDQLKKENELLRREMRGLRQQLEKYWMKCLDLKNRL